jgi:hypothetical protein
VEIVCGLPELILYIDVDIDVLECAKCHGPMKLIALVIDLQSAARYLAKIGEPTELPARSKSRGPPYWKSTVLRRKTGA